MNKPVSKPAYVDRLQADLLQNLSQPCHGMVVEHNRSVILRDGVRLAVDVYRPEGAGTFPALVGFTPFGKEVQAIGLERDPIQLGRTMYDQSIEIGSIPFFVERGYAIVIPNPRGISTSEGVWTGLLSPQDQRDCCDVIEWAAAQPWCSGKVGMHGIGHAGRIQPLVAALQPPHLAAIAPIEAVDDLYLDSYWGGTVSDSNYPLCSYIPVVEGISEAELENTPEKLRELLAAARAQKEIATNSYYYRGLDSWPPRHYTWNVDILLHPLDGPFWARRSIKGQAHKIKIPVYAMSLYIEYGRSTAGACNLYTDPDLEVPKKLMLIEPHVDKCLPYDRVNIELLRWYDHWLKGADTGVMAEPPIKILVMGENRYRYEREWPIARTTWSKFFLTPAGELRKEPVAEQSVPDRLHHTPPTLKSQMPDEVPCLRYTSKPFKADTEATGPCSVLLHAAIDVEDAHFTAKLWDVDERGMRRLLSIGHLKASHRSLIKSRSTPHTPVHDHTAEQPVTPGEILPYHIEMPPFSNLFKAGHRVELEVKAMDQQGYSFTEVASLPRLYTSGRVAGAHPSATETNYRFYNDADHPSHVLLPVIPHTLAEDWLK